MRALHLAIPPILLALACGPRPPAAGPPAGEPTPPAAPVDPRAFDSWANGAVFYEVFVRSFQDSDGDGKGDLRGLIDRLDYLNDGDPATDTDLGVDALWLMPVFASPSYHGYDTTDYENINPDYGTNEDFTRLLSEAERRGMKIVVDLVLNHSSSKHPWFLDSASSPTSPKRDWYVWSPTNPGWGQPWNPAGQTWHPMNGSYYYGVFWSGMPDLNYRNPQVRAEAKRIAALWLDRGVAGFRLDATRHLIETGPGDTGQNDTPETHEFLREFAGAVRAQHPRAVLIGENWTETPIIARYFGDTSAVPGGDQLPLNFDFPLAGRIIASARQGEAAPVASKIEEIQKTYPPGATWVPFLTNHDMKRVATNLGSDQARLRVAAAIMLTLPGTPFLYYGEEIGMENGPGDEDEWKRTPMPWDGSTGGGFTTGRPWRAFAPGHATANIAAQTGDPSSLLSHYRRLIRARQASPALRRGKLELLTTEGPVLAYVVGDGVERVLVAHNLGADPQRPELAIAGGGEPILAEGAALAPTEGGGTRLTLPPHGSGIWRLR
jgi:alpha-amylase